MSFSLWSVVYEFSTDSAFAAPEPKPKKNRELKTEILPVGVPTGGNTPANTISPAAGLPSVGTTVVGTPAAGTPTAETPTG